MIHQGWKSQNQGRPAEPEPFRTLEAKLRPGKGPHWLDSMLGQGSRKALGQALGPFERAGRQALPSGQPMPVKRMEAVGAEPRQGRKRKGLIRMVLAGSAALWALAQFRPWESLGGLGPAREVKAREESREGHRPILEPSGKALALWHAEDGSWFEVNADAELRPVESKEAMKRLDLPRLAGARVLAEEKRGGRMLKLDLKEGLLEDLLPMEESLASEVESVWIEGDQVRLKTHNGTWAVLGDAEFSKRQARLSAVLSDLAARKKRASSVDMRFEGSAVVRLASR